MSVFWSKLCLFMLMCLGFSSWISARQVSKTVIEGRVTDSKTGDPIPFANIIFVGKRLGTTTDMDGKFSLVSSEATAQIQISYIGYKTELRSIKVGQTQYLDIKMSPEIKTINEVVIKPSKRRYRNKENPAVELMQNVIRKKSANIGQNIDYLEYEKYEKIEFALSNLSEKFKQRKVFKKFRFVFDNVDTTKIPGKEVLPFYLKESVTGNYYRKEPKNQLEIVKADKKVSFDGYLDDQGITEYMKYLYQDIDIYDNDITVLTNQFLGPVATTAPAFYKYFIADTSLIDDQKCVRIFFSPRNKTDLLFQGYLYICLDSTYAIRRVDMSVNKDINLNWVRSLHIKQDFGKTENQPFLLSSSEIDIDFGLTKNNLGIYGQRSVSFEHYKINVPNDSVFCEKGNNDKPVAHTEKEWNKLRHAPLSASEKGVYTTMDSVQKIPAFKNAMDLFMLVFAGYKDFGYFEIGPVSTFYSYNPIEGARLRFGGRTTNKLSKKLNFETYGAYGFNDKEFKYYTGLSYSLSSRSIFEFPVKSVRLSYQKETKIPGQELQFVQEDNILLSIKRGVNDKLLYNQSFKIDHLNEFANHFSYSLGYEFTHQTPAGNLYFNNISYTDHRNTQLLNISEVHIGLRYAPHETFYQGKSYRTPIINKYPIIQLQYSLGEKRIGNDYDYSNIKLNVYKRFYLSVFGYTDATFEAGKIFGTVSYPLLFIHRANQTYSYQLASYNLMNFLEFVSDQYVSVNIDHCFNGFIFNKIPLMRKLKFREVATCKVLYGGVNEHNRPAADNGLFRFPADNNGIPITYTLESKPYVEASVGISNILKFFRVDMVKRLTYLDHPNVADIGVRMRFKFDF